MSGSLQHYSNTNCLASLLYDINISTGGKCVMGKSIQVSEANKTEGHKKYVKFSGQGRI